jgi:hypothetical protein
VTTIAAAPRIHSIACKLPPWFGSPPLPVAGGRGGDGGATTTVRVDVAGAAGVGVADPAGVGVAGVDVADPAGVEVADPVGVELADPVGVDVADPVGVEVADPVGVEVADPVGVDVAAPVGVDVADAVGVGVSGVAATKFDTLAVQLTSAPPPLPEPLHWSMFTGSVVVIVEDPDTVHMNATLVPPLPEPLHWPTVA